MAKVRRCNILSHDIKKEITIPPRMVLISKAHKYQLGYDVPVNLYDAWVVDLSLIDFKVDVQ